MQLKPVGPCVYVVVNSLDEASAPPYRIHNRTKHFVLHFRQLGCEAHPWIRYVKSASRQGEIGRVGPLLGVMVCAPVSYVCIWSLCPAPFSAPLLWRACL